MVEDRHDRGCGADAEPRRGLAALDRAVAPPVEEPPSARSRPARSADAGLDGLESGVDLAHRDRARSGGDRRLPRLPLEDGRVEALERGAGSRVRRLEVSLRSYTSALELG